MRSRVVQRSQGLSAEIERQKGNHRNEPGVPWHARITVDEVSRLRVKRTETDDLSGCRDQRHAIGEGRLEQLCITLILKTGKKRVLIQRVGLRSEGETAGNTVGVCADFRRCRETEIRHSIQEGGRSRQADCPIHVWG